jgi:hypothetical protein
MGFFQPNALFAGFTIPMGAIGALTHRSSGSLASALVYRNTGSIVPLTNKVEVY